jgi:hypothetical protein
MTGYLMRLATRSSGTARGLRPRAPSLFEAAPAIAEVALPDASTPSAQVPIARPAPAGPLAFAPADRPLPPLRRPEPSRSSDIEIVAPPAPPPAAVATAAASADGAARPDLRPDPPARTGDHAPVAGPLAVIATSGNESPTIPPHSGPGQRAPAAPDRLSIPPIDAQVGTASVLPTAPADPPDDVALPRLHPGPTPAPPAPEVKVSIGRIEVVAASPDVASAAVTPATPPVRPTTPRRATGAPALADYLRDRSRR